jgi:hypothetical protein
MAYHLLLDDRAQFAAGDLDYTPAAFPVQVSVLHFRPWASAAAAAGGFL